MSAYQILDYLFLVFHLVVVLFNLIGWLWKSLRRANLILLILTGLSWFGLGILYGWGYCPLTDWHWKVLHHLGEWPSETSYIQYLIRRMSGWHIDGKLVDTFTIAGFIMALFISVVVNVRGRK